MSKENEYVAALVEQYGSENVRVEEDGNVRLFAPSQFSKGTWRTVGNIHIPGTFELLLRVV